MSFMPTDATVPPSMTAEKLRKIADWLDTYDRMGAEFAAMNRALGLISAHTIEAAEAAMEGKSVQDDLRRWAEWIDDGR